MAKSESLHKKAEAETASKASKERKQRIEATRSIILHKPASRAMDNQAPNMLDLNGLSRKEKKQRLFELLKAFPAHVSYSQRLHQLAAHLGITSKLIFQTARREGWQARLAAELAAERENDEYANLLELTAPRTSTVGASQIASSIRGTVFTLLTASRKYVETCCQQIQYYSDKIALRIAEAGGLAALDTTAAKDIAELQAKLSFVAKQLGPYMQPSAIATLLGVIGYVAPLNEEGVETHHFTAHALQQRLLELGMMSGAAFADPVAATTGYGLLPILSGFVNEHDNSEVKYYQGEIPDDLLT